MRNVAFCITLLLINTASVICSAEDYGIFPYQRFGYTDSGYTRKPLKCKIDSKNTLISCDVIISEFVFNNVLFRNCTPKDDFFYMNYFGERRKLGWNISFNYYPCNPEHITIFGSAIYYNVNDIKNNRTSWWFYDKSKYSNDLE